MTEAGLRVASVADAPAIAALHVASWRAAYRDLAPVRIAGWGYSGAALGVVAGNDGAVAFYQALGGRLAGRYLDPGPLWRSENLIFVWDELSELGGGGRF